ncbi:conserved hypothetical protein [Streptomyces scabiei 87.22]|uniref:Secreted protein n=1 Tax=Streptomyces scabiei (strain 87.22) TaxID=680198 RepID=C9YZV6_STRSW|nr:hypothetical protein [Streptomyces scabiei]MDX2575369.1 hypothetical protein [Streptomyces scabiei]MDX2654436.1 hypothetical protein [Streptomyces scabiei]MDX2719003.1 hypothetical protein [Streptomyces scabiei]MDX2866808.1 hypothetical protein [Streptomyces scabiei]MDX2885195.1 hypothetical protein [Streptomyces scabiei]
MRVFRSIAPAVLALALALLPALPSAARPADRPDPFGAACRSTVTGSRVTAHCYNPYASVDRVRLHIECARWWDIDSDSAAVAAGPAQNVRLAGRCWKEVRSVWFSHQRGEG